MGYSWSRANLLDPVKVFRRIRPKEDLLVSKIKRSPSHRVVQPHSYQQIFFFSHCFYKRVGLESSFLYIHQFIFGEQ